MSKLTGSWAVVVTHYCSQSRRCLSGMRPLQLLLLMLLLLQLALQDDSLQGNETLSVSWAGGMQNSSSSSMPPVVVTTTASQCSQGETMDMAPRSDWCCDCWNGHESDQDVELQCRCMGQSLQRVPQKLPATMHRLTVVQGNLLKLRYIGLQRYAGTLRDIMLADVPLFETIESGALGQCSQLRTLYISQAPLLTHLPHDVFMGVPDTFRSLRIINCGLQHVPDMTHLSTHVILHMVDLEGNQIVRVNSHAVRIKTEQLILDNNPIEYVDQLAFYGSEIAKISLKGNVRLSSIHPAAFAGIGHVQEIDLSNTALQSLPTEGLGSLEILRIQNTHTLRTIPSVYHFKNLRIAWLTHPFHCCAFKFPMRHDPQRYQQRQNYLAQLKRTCIDNGLIPATNVTTQANDEVLGNETGDGERTNEWSSWARLKRSFWNGLAGIAGDPRGFDPLEKQTGDGHYFGGFNDDTVINAITGKPSPANGGDDAGDFGDTFDFQAPDASMDFGVFHESEADINPNSVLKATCGNLSQNDIVLECYPKPDALNPCEDVMGAQWLRISVWVVVFLAVVGNVAVLLVLFSSCKDVTVTKFLMSNLAFADLCLGLYLLLIAAIDLHSIGEYFNYGYEWQYGVGCQAAGFLSVFASHLSVFTLCIITLERWFAIRFAMQLNKRITLRSALIIMLGGWTYSVAMSALPLFGISNYSSTSICLPMEARDIADVVYLVMIISNSGLAFCFIAICYAQIYMSLGKDTRQAHRHESRNEMTVAKKMALLVFTNFACWAPIAFFGLTALAGTPFIDVAKSKILLVFFYPLNSCADPYLYAILTAQYRRDLFMLLGRCGLCKGKARAFNNNNNSLPMLTTQTLLTRRSSSMDRGGATSRKASRDLIMRREEEFV